MTKPRVLLVSSNTPNVMLAQREMESDYELRAHLNYSSGLTAIGSTTQGYDYALVDANLRFAGMDSAFGLYGFPLALHVLQKIRTKKVGILAGDHKDQHEVRAVLATFSEPIVLGAEADKRLIVSTDFTYIYKATFQEATTGIPGDSKDEKLTFKNWKKFLEFIIAK